MSQRLQGHRTKLNANKMTCDGRCSSRRKQPVFSSFSRTVQSSGVAWTWAATLTPWRNLADCSTLAPQPPERHGRRQWTADVELNGEDLSCYSHKIEPVSITKYPYDHWLAYLSAITVTDISQSFTYKMAAKNQLAQIWNKITSLSTYNDECRRWT